MMTTLPTDDFKLSTEDRLFRNNQPPTSQPVSQQKTSLWIPTLLLMLFLGQAGLWYLLNHQDQATSQKINLLQSTLDTSRTQTKTIDQKLSATFLQGSEQMRSLTEKIAQLEKTQSSTSPAIATPDPNTAQIPKLITQVQTLSDNLKTIEETQKQVQQTQSALQLSQTQLQQDISSLNVDKSALQTTQTQLQATQTQLQTTQTQQQALSGQMDGLAELIQQVNDFKENLATQQKEQQSLQSSLQALALQVSTLAEEVNTPVKAFPTPSAEETRSLNLYRQQVNERLDQLTESVRKLKYPDSGKPNP